MYFKSITVRNARIRMTHSDVLYSLSVFGMKYQQNEACSAIQDAVSYPRPLLHHK